MSLLHAVRTRLRLALARRAAEARMAEEVALHIDLEADRLAREHGLDAGEARRRALVAFGGVERYREEIRDGRGLAWLGGLSLDLRLALRMMAKHPGLSLVSVLGMALAIAIGVVVFGSVAAVLDPTLPLAGGDRIVAVQTLRADAPGDLDRQVLHDLETWRTELTTVRDLGAFRLVDRNLIAEDGVAGVVPVAEMSAAGFRVGGVPPLLGRALVDDDECAGEPTVLVIGHREWLRYFGGDPDVVGRRARLGETVYTVVGVLPEGFRFPYDHGFWVPLRLEASRYAPGAGPSIEVFGRLADGVTLERARTQVAAIGRRLAAAYPESHGYRRPTVVPFARSAGITATDAEDAWRLYLLQLGASLLLAVVATNVAALVYARTATRTAEIAVRTALGASRGRVVTQLFVEALLLCAVAATVGLSLAGFAFGWVERLLAQGPGGAPFWFDITVSPGLLAYVGVLTLLGGTVVGLVPALKATGRRAYGNLQHFAAAGAGMKLGPTWTALIVAQVAITVAILPASVHHASVLLRTGMRDPGYPAGEFLRASLSVDREEAPIGADSAAFRSGFDARFAARADALLQRLASEPGVSASFVSAHAGSGPYLPFEIEGDAIGGDVAAAPGGRQSMMRASITWASVGIFELFDTGIVAGRGFVPADTAEESTAVVVDTAFASRLAGGSVLGRRIRVVLPQSAGAPGAESAAPGWLEIVGVVAAPPPATADPDDVMHPNVYRAATLGALRQDGPQAAGLKLRMRVRSGVTPAFTRRLRDVVAATDPGFRLHGVTTDEAVFRSGGRMLRVFALTVAGTTLSVLLLSVAGIFAMLSFTVAQRRREIGVRAALGASPRQIVGGIFRRAAVQLGTGVAVGLVVALALERVTDGMILGSSAAGVGLRGPEILMPIVAAIVMTVGLLAALGPVRRGLAVHPREALREG
ncbi:MAG TPA: ABC transporter permease [Gemmatimonadaceae bacterium]